MEAEGLSEREKLAIDYGKRLVGPLGANWDIIENCRSIQQRGPERVTPWGASEVAAVR